MGLDGDLVRAAAAAACPADLASVFRTVFETYAEAQGKPGWGDKTPGYVEHLPLLAHLFPDARVIHIIRDGRSVAASIASQPWGPPTPVSAAWWWRGRVRRGRRDGARLGARYIEVRYEELIADPIVVLSSVCRHLGAEYDPAMLDYASTAPERLPPGTTRTGRLHERTRARVRHRRSAARGRHPLFGRLGNWTRPPHPPARC